MEKCDNTYQKMSFIRGERKLFRNSRLKNAGDYSLDPELGWDLHMNWCPLNEEAFGARPILAFLWDLHFQNISRSPFNSTQL